MNAILSTTGPIYLSIAVGFLAARWGLVSKADGQVLGRFVLNFALPAMLFNALASRNFQDVLHPDYLLAYALGSLLSFGVVWWLARRTAAGDGSLRALMGMGSSCSNSGYIGYPILLQLLGPAAGVGLALTLLVENLLMIPLGLSLAESGRAAHAPWQQHVKASLVRLTRSPLMWAIVLGFFFSMLGWRLPEAVGRTVNLFSAASVGTALFVNGCSLVGLRVQGLAPQVSGILLAKLLLHPFGVGLFLWLLGPVEPTLMVSGLVLASMPMMGIYPIFAQRYGHEGRCAAALLMTTLASFVTINALLVALRWWPGAPAMG